MTEDEARAWIENRYSHKCVQQLAAYVELLLTANRAQNLISRASEPHIWVRHILDSAQLHRLAPGAANWLDVGSGAGLPGIVVAILTSSPVMLVEPRRKRAEFLTQVVDQFGLNMVEVRPVEVGRLSAGPFAAVTARAYAPLPDIFASVFQLTEPATTWVLPKGRSAERELAIADEAWQGVFHVEPSLTDADAHIVVATQVRLR